MWKKIWAIVVCVVSVSGSCVFADTPVVNARENNQEKRNRGRSQLDNLSVDVKGNA
jgi:hypothetical protein